MVSKSVLVVDSYAGEYASRLADDFPDLEVRFFSKIDHARSTFEWADVLIGFPSAVDDNAIKQASKLQWLQLLSSGTDYIARLPSLKKDVIVTSTQGLHGPPVSEAAFLHMLTLSRHYDQMWRNRENARWNKPPQNLLYCKTVLIVGVGTIATEFAPRCKAFGMNVVGVSSTPRMLGGFDRMVPREQLAVEAANADFVVAMLPLTPATNKIFDASIFGAMKPTSVFINVARGGVCDEDALLDALRAGRIAGAGLDTFTVEPLPPTHPFWSMENVVLTPHIGGEAAPYAELVWPIICANMRSFLESRPLEMLNRVAR